MRVPARRVVVPQLYPRPQVVDPLDRRVAGAPPYPWVVDHRPVGHRRKVVPKELRRVYDARQPLRGQAHLLMAHRMGHQLLHPPL